MASYLCLTWDGAGNQIPALGLAEALAARGDEVVFAGAEGQRALFEGRGFRFHALAVGRGAPGVSRLNAHPVTSWANPEHPRALAALVDRSTPARLIIDCLMFGALAGAEASGLAATVLVHSAPNALVPPGGSMDRLLLPAVNALRGGLGLGALSRLQDAWAPFTVLVASIPELDPPGSDRALNYAWVGPLFPSEVDDMPAWPEADGRPLVLASFSTGSAWDQSSRIARTAAALADLPCQALFTTARADAQALERPANAVFVAYAPHRPILARAQAVVTHAGHGTVCAALAAGVPMVCLPNRGADQEALAERVAALGAGIALDGDTATPDDIRRAVETVLGEPRFKDAARQLGDRIAAAPGLTGLAI